MQRSDNHLSTSTESLSCPIPQADARIGREVWQSLRRAFSPLTALRMFPPIHVGNRQAAVNIPIDNFKIPAGERVRYSTYLTQRDPNHWPGPDDFHPERFDRSSGIKPAAFSFLPFGGGPRTCIGAAFAQVEVKAVLARLLSKVNLTLNDTDVQSHMGATLEPRPGVMMRIQHREPA